MCGRYNLTANPHDLIEHFEVAVIPFDLAELHPRYNIAPSQTVPAVRMGEGGRELTLLRWGLVPSWAKDPKTGYKMINARAETVATKPAFRVAFKRHRCLIPATGFYEWQAIAGGKQPYHIGLRDGGLLAFAGLWEHWRGEGEGEVIESCSIIVTEANALVRTLHDRMPVILKPQDYARWLNSDVIEAETLTPLLQPHDATRMRAYKVSKHVNNARNDDATCLAPVEDRAI